MATTEELLAQLEAEAQSETPVCVIDPETRTITVPPEYQLLGVENDKRVERIPFRCPKIVGDNKDLSQDFILFINYVNANGDPDAYKIEDMQVDGDNISFSWLLEEKVTLYQGDIQISFCGIIPGDEQDDPDKNRWGTTINTDCTVLTGLKSTQQVAESNPDALAQIWAAIDELKAGGGESGGGTGSSVTTDHANTLWAIIQKTAFAEQLTDEELTAFKTAWGIEAVVVPATGITLNKTTLSFTDSSSQTLIATVKPSNSTDSVTWETSDAGIATVSSGVVSPVSNGSCTITAKAGSYSASCKVTVNVSGEIVTLQSISVTYAGGEVTVGTALTDLTGITVTAHYSNGSTDTITGYTLSGEIVEGENTIMVSYEGKTTTFTVVGYVEEAETTEPVYRLAEATTFDGTNTVDTGYALCENYKAFTVVVDFTSTTKSGSVFGCDKNASYGVGVKCQSGYYWSVYWGSDVNKDVNNASNGVKYVITHEVNSNIAKAYYIYKDALTTQELTIHERNYNSNMNFTNTVILGNHFTGIINDFKIYESVLSQEEINAYVGV